MFCYHVAALCIASGGFQVLMLCTATAPNSGPAFQSVFRRVLMQEAAKEAAKEAGMSDDEEEEEEGTIRQVMPGETAAAAMAAAAAAANAQLPTTVSFLPFLLTCLALRALTFPRYCRPPSPVAGNGLITQWSF